MKSPLLSSNELVEILSLSENATAIYTTEQLIIQSANEAMLRFWGKDRQVIGLCLKEAIPEPAGQLLFEKLQAVWHTGITCTAKDTPVRLLENGWYKTFYFDFTYRAIKNTVGEVYCILHTATDATERYIANSAISKKEQALADLNTKLRNSNEELAVINEELRATNDELLYTQRAQLDVHEKLQENEQRLQGILDTMAEGVGIIDTTGQLVYANTMAQKILGLTESNIKERTYDDPRWQNLRVDGTPLPNEEHPMAIMMTSGKPVYDYEIGVQPTGKERFYISINAAPLFDNAGNLTGGIGTFMDVTARRKDLQRKDDFISIASHELKTPITSLKASLQLLDRMKEAPSPTLLPRLVDQCNRSIDKVANLVEELLDSSKMLQGQLQLNKTTFTIAEMLTQCCHHVRMAGKYELVLQGDEQLQIGADEQRIEQVVVNLVNNAVKYAPQSMKIFLTVEKLTGMAKISVKDTGPGIPPEKLPYLFNRYYQADGGSKQAGLGLGLYISAEIIKRHGGEIGVASEPGKGSTFWFTLPY